MKGANTHLWNVNPSEAVAIQNRLRNAVRLQFPGNVNAIQFVAGADVSFNRSSSQIFAAVVIVAIPTLEVVHTFQHIAEVNFPYIPGLLSFREVPALWPILQEAAPLFDVLICDAQGIAHPRRLGLASHVGVLLNKPTIGCAKSRLIGTYQEPAEVKGAFSYLWDEDEKVGAVVRTRNGVKPVFVSPGHLMDVETAIRIVLMSTHKFRLPEPTRQAHILVNQLRHQHKE